MQEESHTLIIIHRLRLADVVMYSLAAKKGAHLGIVVLDINFEVEIVGFRYTIVVARHVCTPMFKLLEISIHL